MKERESVPVPRGWTGRAAWNGAGASLLLHLSVAAAMIFALSGPPAEPPQVIDLTLLPPAGSDRGPVPPLFRAAAKPPGVSGTDVLPEPPAPPPAPPVASPPAATAPSAIPVAEEATGASAPGSRHALAAPPAAAPAGTGQAPPREDGGSSPGRAAAGTPAADFAGIRDAIQHAIAYPATARRMGWEGKVVVAFQLLSDGSVRDVRVVQGSGHAALDRGAIDAVRNASPFPRSPVEAEVITPVVYRLTTR